MITVERTVERAAPVETYPQPRRVRAIDRRHVGLGLIAIFLALVAVFSRGGWHLDTGDSNNLVRGARATLKCLSGGQFVRCGYINGTIHTYVHHFPVLQYFPAIFLSGLRLGDAAVLRGLAWISLLAFAGALACIVATFRTRPKHGVIAVLCILASSFVYQATSAFGEALTAALIVAAVCAAIRRRPFELFLLVLLASMGKETLAPFVVALVLICARDDADRLFPRRALVWVAVGGGALAMTVNAAFNIFRYGSIGDRLYLSPYFRTPGIAQKVEYLAAIVVSPAGGVVWYWPVFSIVAVAATVVGFRRALRREQRATYLPVLGVSCITAVWLASLSAWFSPFGWVTYGPRLQVPLLAGLAVAYVHLVGDSLVRAVARWKAALVIAGVALCLGAVQFGAPWRAKTAIAHLVSATPGCPRFTELDVTVDAPMFYRCFGQALWRVRPFVLGDLLPFGLGIAQLAWMVGLVGALILLRFVVTNGPSRSSPIVGRSGRSPRSIRSSILLHEVQVEGYVPITLSTFGTLNVGTTIAEAHMPGHDSTTKRIRARGSKPRQRGATRRRREDDAGFTLVDVVVSITLIGIVVIPMIYAMFTSVKASATSREIAEVETVLQNAADRVNRAPVGCDYKIYVEAAAQSKGWTASHASATYQYYVPGATAKASDPGTWEPGGCPNGVRTSGLVQLVTVTVMSESGHISRSVKVVKSDV